MSCRYSSVPFVPEVQGRVGQRAVALAAAGSECLLGNRRRVGAQPRSQIQELLTKTGCLFRVHRSRPAEGEVQPVRTGKACANLAPARSPNRLRTLTVRCRPSYFSRASCGTGSGRVAYGAGLAAMAQITY